MNGFHDVMKMRRSIRDYEDREVPLETVKDIIKDSCFAPSSANGQPWRFIIILNRDLIKRLSDENKQNLLSDLEKNPGSPTKNYELALRNPAFNVFYNAPCLVYIIGRKDIRTLQIDCALAAGYFMFSAVAKGLGTCWIGLGRHVRNPELLDLLGIPDDYQIVAPIILGYPKNIPTLPERNEPQILNIIS